MLQTGLGVGIEGAPARLPDGNGARRIQRAAKISAFVGIVHGILLITAFVLVSRYGPGPDPGNQQYTEFFASERNQRLVFIAGIYLIPFAGIAFFWFSVALRSWFQGRVSGVDELLLNLGFVSGIIYVALLFCAGAALSLVAIEGAGGVERSTNLLSATFVRYGSSLFLIFALRMAAMVVFSTSRLAMENHLFPRWFVYAGYPIGLVLLLSSTIEPRLVVVFPLWLGALAALLLRRLDARQPTFSDRKTGPSCGDF
jgi:hypothetical protein